MEHVIRMTSRDDDLTRRDFVAVTVAAAGLHGVLAEAEPVNGPAGISASYFLTINGQRHDFQLEPRVTLLDLLRERIGLTGTKKGCDHGQCGACTVLVDGVRITSCLALAIAQQGKQIATIEGLRAGEELHPLQSAFIEYDGFQCGFCTSGQICSAVGMLREARSGMPSAVTLAAERRPVKQGAIVLDEDEIRERMSGNICRCGAYPNIVAAIQAVDRNGHTEGAPEKERR